VGSEKPIVNEVSASWPASWYWWFDAVGGYLALRTGRVSIGRPRASKPAIEILGDLSARHADICREADGFTLEAVEETLVNDQPIKQSRLRHGDRIRARSVVLEYRQPCPWRHCAQLAIVSRHRMPLALDGVLLMGDACWIGGADSLVRTDWTEEVKLVWSVSDQRYWVQSGPPLAIDGKKYDKWGPLTPTSRVQGPWVRFASSRSHRRRSMANRLANLSICTRSLLHVGGRFQTGERLDA
jgi:hypothetical protein